MTKHRDIRKLLSNLPKDRSTTPTRQESYFSPDEWMAIYEAYHAGTAVKTIYEALPPPKNANLNAFRNAFENWRKYAKRNGVIDADGNLVPERVAS